MIMIGDKLTQKQADTMRLMIETWASMSHFFPEKNLEPIMIGGDMYGYSFDRDDEQCKCFLVYEDGHYKFVTISPRNKFDDRYAEKIVAKHPSNRVI